MNRLLFLGTGAADWDLTCKGDFFRRNSAVLVNDRLMIDCGAHIFDFAESIGRPDLYQNVTDILITHNHTDHCCKDSVYKLAQQHPIRVCCSKKTAALLGTHPNLTYLHPEPFVPFSLHDFTVIPLLANHGEILTQDDFALHYILITSDQKVLFYGLDGAWFLRPSWEVMKQYQFDLMVLDCTVGDQDDWRIFEHNTIPMLRMIVKEIRAHHMQKEHGNLIASHLARTLHPSQEETAAILQTIQMTVAFDGMELEF